MGWGRKPSFTEECQLRKVEWMIVRKLLFYSTQYDYCFRQRTWTLKSWHRRLLGSRIFGHYENINPISITNYKKENRPLQWNDLVATTLTKGASMAYFTVGSLAACAHWWYTLMVCNAEYEAASTRHSCQKCLFWI